MPVRILPPETVALIRAGEVAERPAAIVRELVENAIDAGAMTIHVSLKDGGRKCIIVDDDGRGMDIEDLTLSVERHATSKLDSGDLSRVSTMGFRGEALPSIAAVARLVIETRHESEDHGWRLVVRDGEKTSPEPAARRSGTRVTVDGLFSSYPARAKFLRSARQEGAQAVSAVTALALAHPEVGFRIELDGRVVLSVREGSAESRVRAIYGEPFWASALAVDGVDAERRVYGWMARPTRAGDALHGPLCIVNGRPVTDRLVQQAVRAAVSDVSKSESLPYCLFLELPAADVDVNVHPAKAEVRFANQAAIRALIGTALTGALDGPGARGGGQLAAGALEQLARRVVIDPERDDRNRPMGRIIGQVLDGFLIAETAAGMVIVDQHAAHERIVYERMKAAVEAGGVAARALDPTAVIPVGSAAAALLDEAQEELAVYGLRLMDGGDGYVIVTHMPDLLGAADPQGLVRAIAKDLVGGGGVEVLRRHIHEVCSTFACHHAIRLGDRLDDAEASDLLRMIEETARSGQCNHGRPTSILFTEGEIRRLFER